MKTIDLTVIDEKTKKTWPIFVNPTHFIWAEKILGSAYVSIRCDTGGIFSVTQSSDDVKKLFEDATK